MSNPYEHLHAYWRMEYIETPASLKGNNPFAELPKLGDDKDTLILFRGKTGYLILNRYPYNAGHLLVLPFREVVELEELNEEEQVEFLSLIIRGKKILEKALNPAGFNIGMNLGAAAGAGIPGHLHAHIVPRWNGDTNFMPVLGQTRVLPTSLEAMWFRLREVSESLEA